MTGDKRGVVKKSSSPDILASVVNNVVRLNERKHRKHYIREAVLPSKTDIVSVELDSNSMKKITEVKNNSQIKSYDGWTYNELIYLTELCAFDKQTLKTPSSIYEQMCSLVGPDMMMLFQVAIVFIECGIVDEHKTSLHTLLDLCTDKIINNEIWYIEDQFYKFGIVAAVLHATYKRFTHDHAMLFILEAIEKLEEHEESLSAQINTIELNMKLIYYRILTMIDQEHMRKSDVIKEDPSHSLSIEIEKLCSVLGFYITRVHQERVSKWVKSGMFDSVWEPGHESITYAAMMKLDDKAEPIGYITVYHKPFYYTLEEGMGGRKSEKIDQDTLGTLEKLGLKKPIAVVKYLQARFTGRGIGSVLLLYVMAKITESGFADTIALEDVSSGRFYTKVMKFKNIREVLKEHDLSSRQTPPKFMYFPDLKNRLEDGEYVKSVLEGLYSESRKDILPSQFYFNRYNYGIVDPTVVEAKSNIDLAIRSTFESVEVRVDHRFTRK